jgi:hypothetical protein
MCPISAIAMFDPSPRIFVSVASKGFRTCVSGLESTLADIPVSVDSEGVGDGIGNW